MDNDYQYTLKNNQNELLFLDLPPELILEILSYLDLNDIYNFSSTCKIVAQIIRYNKTFLQTKLLDLDTLLEKNCIDAIRILINRNSTLSNDLNKILIWAAENGHIEMVKYLVELSLKRGVHPSIYNNYILKMTAENGHFEIVKILVELPLKRGIDPSVQNNIVLRLAAEYRHFKIVKLLVELPSKRGVDPSANNNYVLKKLQNMVILKL